MSSLTLYRSYFPQRITPIIQFIRQSSSGPPTTTEKIGPNLEIRRITSDESVSRLRPLVVLIGWMMAKKRHLDKYGNLYLSKGFDVLNINVPPSKILRPKEAQSVMQKVLDTLGDLNNRDKPLMIHGFSVGGYLYGEMLVKLRDNAAQYAGIRNRMVGQVFDSPVDFVGIPRGFSTIIGFNSLSRAMIKSSIEGYLRLFKNITTKYYIRSSDAFHQNEMNLPSLVLYSRADPIGDATIIEQVAQKWKDNGARVHLKCWDNTPHVSHFHRHPDEYVEAILAFIQEIGLCDPESQENLVQVKAAHVPDPVRAKKQVP